MKKSLLVLFGLLIGCGAGAVGVELVAAQPLRLSSAAPRWEHRCDEFDDADELSSRARRAGDDGWELVAVHSIPHVAEPGQVDYEHVACFKRLER